MEIIERIVIFRISNVEICLFVQIIFKDFRQKQYPPSCKICKTLLVTILPSRLQGRRLIILITTGQVIKPLNDIYHRMLIIRCSNCSTEVHIWQVRSYTIRQTIQLSYKVHIVHIVLVFESYQILNYFNMIYYADDTKYFVYRKWLFFEFCAFYYFIVLNTPHAVNKQERTGDAKTRARWTFKTETSAYGARQ